jgi:hypothetical protein
MLHGSKSSRARIDNRNIKTEMEGKKGACKWVLQHCRLVLSCLISTLRHFSNADLTLIHVLYSDFLLQVPQRRVD